MTNSEHPEILIVDKTNINADLINDIFCKHQITTNFSLTQSIPDLLAKLEQETWQAIFLFIDDIPISVDALIESMPDINKHCPVIVINQNYDRETALTHIRSGATDVFSLDEIDYLAKLTKKLLSRNQLTNTIKIQNCELNEWRDRFTLINDLTPISIAFIHDGAFIHTNPAFQHFFNIETSEDIADISFLDLVGNDDIEKTKTILKEMSNNVDVGAQTRTIKSVNVKKDADSLYPVNLLISQTTINNEPGLQIVFQPTEWEIKSDTASSNQRQLLSVENFIHSLNLVIRNTHKKHTYSLSFFELNDYSNIKNNIGITRSGNLLKEISAFLVGHSSSELKVSRLNSDVYTLLVSADTASDCIKKIETLQGDFSNHKFSSIDKSIKVSCNIGIVHMTNLIHSPDQALSLADVACTVSRNNTQHHLHIYNPEEDRSTVESVDQSWADKIKDALKNNNFRLLYQPIVSLGAEKEKLFEVLLRIKSSGNEDTLPNQFLHFAQQSKLDNSIDKWVIKQSVQTIEKNQSEPIRLFINLSEASLKDINFIEWLQDNYDSQLINLVFEIPEHIALKWPSETLHFIQQIHNLNGEVCIDQFGNHPENQAQIDSLHADHHKIDGTFISNLSTNRKHQSIIHNICLNAQDSNTDTSLIASYVQDADSLAILWREGVDFIQGNYLQPPAGNLDYKFESQI